MCKCTPSVRATFCGKPGCEWPTGEKHRNPDGTYDGAGVLGEIAGLGREEITSIWDQVKANQAKLEACPYHEFEPSIMSDVMTRRRFRCKHCGGQIDATAYYWHEQGRRAAP